MDMYYRSMNDYQSMPTYNSTVEQSKLIMGGRKPPKH